MKGTTPTKAQQDYWTLLCEHVGCIACRKDGRLNTWCSIHHVDGRTKPHAHWLVLPLCGPHHQDNGTTDAVHPFKRRFEDRYGKQELMVRECAEILASKGCIVPDPVLEITMFKETC